MSIEMKNMVNFDRIEHATGFASIAFSKVNERIRNAFRDIGRADLKNKVKVYYDKEVAEFMIAFPVDEKETALTYLERLKALNINTKKVSINPDMWKGIGRMIAVDLQHAFWSIMYEESESDEPISLDGK